MIGAAAESAAAAHLQRLGWTVLARNVRVGPDEIDIVARDAGVPPTVVVVEVRSRAGSGFGSAVESVDRRKVARLYRALAALQHEAHPALPASLRFATSWRVDLLAMRHSGDGWAVELHLRALAPS